jgi:hypothetical protein
MKLSTRITAGAVTLVLSAVPGVALANGGSSVTHGKSQSAPGHTRTHTTGQSKSHPGSSGSGSSTSKGKAYGKLCQGESKKHVKGQKGTPFSQCVVAMAQLAKGTKTNPHTACATESKKHVKGQKGTPYSQCVAAAAKLQGKGHSKS